MAGDTDLKRRTVTSVWEVGLLGDSMDQRRDVRVVDVSWGVVSGVVRWWGDVEAKCK